MEDYIMFFNEFKRNDLKSIGGKGVNLIELTKGGFNVPFGFCVTTKAFINNVHNDDVFKKLSEELKLINEYDIEKVKVIGKKIRKTINEINILPELNKYVYKALEKNGNDKYYAVRSSATAEDLSTASFAGQQDTFLNLKGKEEIVKSIKKCWASLFNDRAIIYRIKNKFEHKKVFISVIVQEMIFPEVSGIMFTADPITNNRNILSIDASYGLGEALVSGLVTADLYQVKQNSIIKKNISKKLKEVGPIKTGGTQVKNIDIKKQEKQALTDKEILSLAKLGKSIEKYYGSEQDIEWCLHNNQFYILQSRPITSLYPFKKIDNQEESLFVSFGHVQMMTEVIKPFGISTIKTFVPINKNEITKESNVINEFGGRIFTNIFGLFKIKKLRKNLPEILLSIDEKISLSVREYINRTEFNEYMKYNKKIDKKWVVNILKLLKIVFQIGFNFLFSNCKDAVNKVNKQYYVLEKEFTKVISKNKGADRIEKIQVTLANFLPRFFRLRLIKYVGTGIASYKLIEILTDRWLGKVEELSKISKSPDGNVTTEIGLMLGDIGEKIKNNKEAVDILKIVTDDDFWIKINNIPDNNVFIELKRFFDIYGMRGTGEIDITRKRWKDTPSQVAVLILNYIKTDGIDSPRVEFEKGKKIAQEYIKNLILKIEKLPYGKLKAIIIKKLIKVHRAYISVREHPKFFIIKMFDLIKEEMLKEAKDLKDNNILREVEDFYWLSLNEFKEVLKNRKIDYNIIVERKRQYSEYEKLLPPRVITGEGELIVPKLNENVPEGALSGTGTSGGIIKGKARVVRNLDEAKIEKGDILITPYTDPAWTSLFPLIAGLVTEVGGLMTHGSVVAREYGIPAVVGVDNATVLIKDGSIIELNGNEGYVKINTCF